MLEGFTGKILAGMLSLSALVFSNYTGNDPVFSPLQSRTGHNYLILKAKLEHAFDNDFNDVFKCGKPVHLWYKIEIRDNNRISFTRNYRHTVSYDPMNASWRLYRSETNQTDIFTSYNSLVSNISELNCSIPLNENWKIVEVRAESWMQSVELSQGNRTIDLMVLWRFKKPHIRTMLNLESTS